MLFAVWTRFGQRNSIIQGPSPDVKGQFWGRKGADPGHARTCLAADIFKATQMAAETVQCGCRLGCTRLERTLAQPNEYDWVVQVKRRCSLMSSYFDNLFLSARLPAAQIVQVDLSCFMLRETFHRSSWNLTWNSGPRSELRQALKPNSIVR